MLYYIEYLVSTVIEADDIDCVERNAKDVFHEAIEHIDEDEVVIFQSQEIKNLEDFNFYCRPNGWSMDCVPFCSDNNTIGEILNIKE